MIRLNRSLVNVICSLLVFATNIAIGFWLSPFVIRHIGIEANGFVSLAGNFVGYAGLINAALSSMAGRFIALEYIKHDYEKANLYYNSVFWGRLIMLAVLLLPAAYIIVELESIVKVPQEILSDIKLLFSLIFFSFFLSTGTPNWGSGTYITNRLDLDYIPNMLLSLMRCALIFLMMTIWIPKVWYIGFTSCVITILLLIVAYINCHRLTPKLKIYISRHNIIFSWKTIRELIAAGIWSTISSVGHLLLSGLDLIICNIYLGPTAMGVVALSKTLPGYMAQLSGSVRGAFGAELTINYAQGNMDAIYNSLNRAMKMTSFIMIVPIAGIVVFGKQFFSLWVPSEDTSLLQILSVLSIIGYMFTSGTQILYNVFYTVNKVKQEAIAMLCSGVASIIMLYLMFHFTDLDIYAVAGCSTVANLIRNMSFTLPMAAKYLGFDWKRFYPQVLQTVSASIVLIIVGVIMRPYLPAGSWGYFFISISLYSVVAFTISMFMLLNKEERRILKEKILNKFKN